MKSDRVPKISAKPATISHTVAAALPLAGLTALQALVDHAAVRPGEAVLVHGGAGGVGALGANWRPSSAPTSPLPSAAMPASWSAAWVPSG